MSQFTFKVEEAKKIQQKGRVAFCGPAGSGKTYTALRVAEAWAPMIAQERGVDLSEIKIGVIDTEHHTARLYSEEPWVTIPYFVIELDPPFQLERCTAAIHYLEDWGADVVIFDSISHAWQGQGGALSEVDRNAARLHGNSYVAWRDVTPKHNEFVDSMVRCKAHIIVCARSKMEYVMTKGDNGKTSVEKIGMAPVQRDGMEYEFDVVGDLNINHQLDISKTRCAPLDGKFIDKPGEELAKIIFDWLGAGAPPPPMLTEQQEAHILYLFGQLMDWLDTDDRAAVNKVLAQKGYPPLHRLTEAEATELIGILEEAAKKAEEKPTDPEPEPKPEPQPEPEPEVKAEEPVPNPTPPAAPSKKKQAKKEEKAPAPSNGKHWAMTAQVGEMAKKAKTDFGFGLPDIIAALNEAEPDKEIANLTQTTLSYEDAWEVVKAKATALAEAA